MAKHVNDDRLYISCSLSVFQVVASFWCENDSSSGSGPDAASN